eukprot:706882_1
MLQGKYATCVLLNQILALHSDKVSRSGASGVKPKTNFAETRASSSAAKRSDVGGASKRCTRCMVVLPSNATVKMCDLCLAKSGAPPQRKSASPTKSAGGRNAVKQFPGLPATPSYTPATTALLSKLTVRATSPAAPLSPVNDVGLGNASTQPPKTEQTMGSDQPKSFLNFCGFCGTKRSGGHIFCGNCG